MLAVPVVCNLWVRGLPRQMTLAAPEAFPEMLCRASTSTCEVPFVSTSTDCAFSPLPCTAEALFATTVSRSTVPEIVHSLVPETSIFSCGLLILAHRHMARTAVLADTRSAAPKIASEVPLVATVAVSAASCSPCSAEADSAIYFQLRRLSRNGALAGAGHVNLESPAVDLCNRDVTLARRVDRFQSHGGDTALEMSRWCSRWWRQLRIAGP